MPERRPLTLREAVTATRAIISLKGANRCLDYITEHEGARVATVDEKSRRESLEWLGIYVHSTFGAEGLLCAWIAAAELREEVAA